MKGKKGFEMAISTIVLLILALILLIALITAFVATNKNFVETIKAYFSSSNVDTIKTQCNNLALSNGGYEYCCEEELIKLSSKQEFEMTCLNASMQGWGSEINTMDCGEVC